MKFSISSKELQAKLSVVSKVILKKNVLRILDNAMVSKSDDKFFLTGASSEHQITVGLDLLQTDNSEFKPFCLDVSQFIAILSTLPEQPLEIEVDDNNYLTCVRYDGGDFTLPSMSAADFPIREKLNDDVVKVGFNIPSNILIPGARAAQQCTVDDDLRPAKMAVALDVNVEGVTFVGTDTNKLYRYAYVHGVPFLTQGSPSVILFPRTLISALEAVVGKTENVSIRANERAIEIVADNAVLLATTLGAKYPDYNRVIPKESNYHFKLPVSDLIMAIKRASIMSDSSTGLMILSKEQDALTIYSTDYGIGKSVTSRFYSNDCNVPDGFKIGLKASNLLLLLGNISTKDVCIHLSDPSKPVVLKEDAENSTLVELVLPMYIENI